MDPRKNPGSLKMEKNGIPKEERQLQNTSSTSTPIGRFIKESSFMIESECGNDESEHFRSNSQNHRSMEVSFGIVHLFRDDASFHDTHLAKTETTLEDDSGSILGILGVPAHIGPADFLQLVQPASDAISQVRMIREDSVNRCMILIKFRDPANAEEFHKMYADRPFDPIDDPNELCRVVYITKVTVSTTSTLPYAYPLLANSDPWPILANEQTRKNNGLGPLQKIPSLVELPTCPVCLERMDSNITGLMTVTCQHTFHCSCLSRWSDSRCPVCRHTQSRLTKKGQYVLPSFVPENGRCAVCGTSSDLWVCLICATVGCGRYKAGHAHRHYHETGHLYSLELETQRVWDYAGDGYVHRLIQSKAELNHMDEGGPNPHTTHPQGSVQMEASSSKAGRGDAANVEEKMEALGLEYSHLLSTQLESQRAFYEDQIRSYQQRAEEAESSRHTLLSSIDEVRAERDKARTQLEALTSRSDHMHKNLDTSLKRVKKLDEELRGEKLMSQGLVSRIDKLVEDDSARQKDIHTLYSENAELKEQVRDLMFFVEARTKVNNEGGEELRGGDLEVANGGQQKGSSGVSSKSKAKKKKKTLKPAMGSVTGTSAQDPNEDLQD